MNKIYDFESGILPIEEKRFDEIVYNDIRLSICEAFLALDDNCQAEHIEHRKYLLRTVRKIIDTGPKPTEGYYIDKNSLKMGVNLYSGLSYIKYTEIRAGTRSAPHWKEWGIAT